MTVINNLDFPNATFGSAKPELFEWTHDLESHAKLVKSYFAITTAQTRLMEQQRASKEYSDETESSDTIDPFFVELEQLDERLTKIEQEMSEIEGRAMTFVPTDGYEAQSMLKFAASVLSFGHKIDADYLADVMTGCADVIQDWETSSKAVEYSMHN